MKTIDVLRRMKNISPENRAILVGSLLVLIVTTTSFGISTYYFTIPEPEHELPDLQQSNGWDFSTGLTLSSQFVEKSEDLVYFFVSDDTNHFKINPNPKLLGGVGLFWGMIQPKTIPSIVEFPLVTNDYTISFNVQTFGVFYEDRQVNSIVTPLELTVISESLTYLLASNKQFQELTAQEYYEGIESYFTQFENTKEDELRIEHGYSDGFFTLIRVLEDTIFIRYGWRNNIKFSGNSDLTAISLVVGDEDSYFYKIKIQDLDLTPYFDNLNYLWYSHV